tara:strand:- start:173 stop:385 length:213 start_codon:yes stop_codon:yes gene_type:complete
MIILENISTGQIHEGNEIEFFVDDDTMIGEVYLDSKLIFQTLDVINEDQLDHALHSEFRVTKEESEHIYN